ncbi:unnamed protein product, partial [Pylaiella littoralis]
PEDHAEEEEGGGEELDPEVSLMPQEGESFAGALDSLEARCRFETRALYEAEGKEELLGESGVPESLKTWLEESRERALGDGGYRQGARTRLRGQVEQFELLIAKRPVPRDDSVGPRAPALMMLDLSSRLEQAGSTRRRKRETHFERALSVWAAARTKHQRLLRPAFGSTDRRGELDELLALEAGRAAEAMQAIASFSRELLQEEAAAVREHAAKIAGCFGGVAAILDSVVMVDDLAKLPGDHGFEQKRRGLRRLRKAERAFLKQQQQQQEQVSAAATSQPGGSRKKSVAAAAAAAGATAEETCTPARTDSRGRGRQWDSRRWRASGLSDLARVVLAAATATATARDSTAAVVDFSAVLEGLTADAGKVTGGGDEKSAA